MLCYAMLCYAMQGKAMQSKARQCKAMQSKAKQGKGKAKGNRGSKEPGFQGCLPRNPGSSRMPGCCHVKNVDVGILGTRVPWGPGDAPATGPFAQNKLEPLRQSLIGEKRVASRKEK